MKEVKFILKSEDASVLYLEELLARINYLGEIASQKFNFESRFEGQDQTSLKHDALKLCLLWIDGLANEYYDGNGETSKKILLIC